MFCGLFCNIFVSYTTIIIDVLRPKLHWISEYSVVKQNLNMLFSVFLSIFLMALILAICAYIDSIFIASMTISAIIFIMLLLYEILLKKYSNIIFRKIQ